MVSRCEEAAQERMGAPVEQILPDVSNFRQPSAKGASSLALGTMIPLQVAGGTTLHTLQGTASWPPQGRYGVFVLYSYDRCPSEKSMLGIDAAIRCQRQQPDQFAEFSSKIRQSLQSKGIFFTNARMQPSVERALDVELVTDAGEIDIGEVQKRLVSISHVKALSPAC